MWLRRFERERETRGGVGDRMDGWMVMFSSPTWRLHEEEGHHARLDAVGWRVD